MKAEYINPFLEAATLVFKQVLDSELIRGKTGVKQSPAPAHEIAILIGITGQVTGQVVYSMNAETVYKIVGKLMPGTDRQTIESEYRDVMGELANMITGNALNIFLKNNEDLDVSVPMVVDVRSQDVPFQSRVTIGLNLYSRYGLVEVNVSIN